MSSITLEKMEYTVDNKVKWLIQPPNLFGVVEEQSNLLHSYEEGYVRLSNLLFVDDVW